MTVEDLVAAELAGPVPAAVATFAAGIAGSMPGTAAVLYYGSCLRDGVAGGILDFYVLTDRPLSPLDRLLPPTVRFAAHDGLRAKVGVMPLDGFRRAMRPEAPSAHLWARFCQPVALAWARDRAAEAAVGAAVAAAVRAAAWWAERLAGGDWEALFRHTYSAELRAERPDRPALLVAAGGDRWQAVAADAFTGATEAECRAARRSWAWRRRLGRVLAAARLVKAAFTVSDGAAYLAWKIERHAGRPVPLSPWQRRHPLLAALPLLVRLRRQGLIR